MANGSFDFTPDGPLQGRIVWSSVSQGAVSNYSSVSATLYARKTDTATTWGRSWSGYVKIGDAQQDIYFDSSVSVGSGWVEMASVSTNVYHNSDGTGSVYISGSVTGPGGTTLANRTSSGGDTAYLDYIPRYLNYLDLYDNGSGLESISARWTCDPARDWTQYSLNGGGWTDAGDSVAWDSKSGYFTIWGLSPGTTYTLKIRARRADSGLWSESNTINITTKGIATITSPGDNFYVNSDSALTVTCNNPSGNQIKYFLDCPNGTRRLTSNATDSTSYTWTATEILSMLQYFTDSNTSSIKVGIATLVNGNETYWNEKVGTLNVVNSNPIFNNYTYEDTNPTTLALTGNNQILVNGYSNNKVTISVANKASAQNYASMRQYQLIQGTKNATANYSSDQNVELTAFGVNNNIMIVSAKDSRGNTTSIQKELDNTYYKRYSELTILGFTATRNNNGVGSNVTLSFNGIFLISFAVIKSFFKISANSIPL